MYGASVVDTKHEEENSVERASMGGCSIVRRAGEV